MPLRMWERIAVATCGCWVWQGNLTAQGYGILGGKHKNRYVHRFVYEHLIGEIPEGLELDHLCRVPACCNPAHLEPVTHHENVMRSPIAPAAINARKTHCKRGHPFDRPYEPGKGRTCEVCRKAYRRSYRRVETPERKAYRLEWNRRKRDRLKAKLAVGDPLTHGEMVVLGLVKNAPRGDV